MKKTYFNPADLHFRTRFAPEMVNRRIFGSGGSHPTAAYRSGGGDDDDDADDDDDDDDEPADKVGREQFRLMRKIKTQVRKQLAGRATKQAVDEIVAQMKDFKDLPVAELREMADKTTGVMKIVTEQGLKLNELTNKLAKLPEDMSIRSQVKRWQETNKDSIVKVIQKESKDLPSLELELRAVASPMTVATVNSTSSPYIGRVEHEGGINDIIRIQPTFWDFITKGRTNAPLYTWVNKTNPQGAAAFIGPGVSKPGVSFSMIADSSIAKKIADSAKCTTELLQDIDGMTTFIEQELRYQVMIKVNQQLMIGVSSTTNPAGLQTVSTTYTLTSGVLSTPNPNNFDAVRAVVAQLRSGLLTGEITVFLNSLDIAQMDLTKAETSGVYLLPPFSTQSGTYIGGARIVEDNNVPQGHIQAAFLRFYRILIYKDFSISWGWENDDFTKNLVTAVGEMRLHQFVNQIHTGFAVYDTLANIKTALTAA